MDCPRCRTEMLEHEAPLPAGESTMVDRCVQGRGCGVWYDGRDLPAAHARFYDPEVRKALARTLQTSRAQGAQRIPCPRCENTELVPVRFVGIELDLCERCGGLWIDRDEYSTLMAALPLYAPSEGDEAATHYRQVPGGAVMKKLPVVFTRCARCKTEVSVTQALYTERGLSCVPCANGLGPKRENDAGQGLWELARRLFVTSVSDTKGR